MTVIANIGLGGFFACMLASIVTWRAGHRDLSDALDLVGDGFYALFTAGFWLHRDWPSAIFGTAFLALMIWMHWRRWRRKRRRSLAALGAKSRARIDAMVRTMKQRARPRGALRPVPGGTW